MADIERQGRRSRLAAPALVALASALGAIDTPDAGAGEATVDDRTRTPTLQVREAGSRDGRAVERPHSSKAEQRSWATARRIADLARAGDTGTAQLALAARSGDRAAFHYLCQANHQRILRIANACVRNHADAEDVAQQVMLRLPEALASYRPEVESFGRWLATIVRNQAIDHLRRSRRTHVEAPDAIDRRRETAGTAAVAHAWRFQPRLKPLLERLPRQQRAVLLLRFGFDLSTHEAAKVLGCSPDCVRQNQRRALLFLAQRLGAASGSRTDDLLTDD